MMTREKQRVYDQTPGKIYREKDLATESSTDTMFSKIEVDFHRLQLLNLNQHSKSDKSGTVRKITFILLMNMITNSTQYTLGTMKDGLLLKPDVLLFQNVKSTSPYIPSTNNSAKNKGKEKSSRATYKKYSQTRNSHTKNTFTYDAINLT